MGTRNASLDYFLNLNGIYSNNLNNDNNLTSSSDITVSFSKNLKNGMGSGQINFIHPILNRVIAVNASFDLDLFDLGNFDIGAGPGKDLHGQSVQIRKIIFIAVYNKTVSSNGQLNIGSSSSINTFTSFFNGTNSTISVPAGGTFFLSSPRTDGFLVADNSNHILRFAAARASQTIDLILGGRTI